MIVETTPQVKPHDTKSAEIRQALRNAQVARPLYAERDPDGRFAPQYKGKAGMRRIEAESRKRRNIEARNADQEFLLFA